MRHYARLLKVIMLVSLLVGAIISIQVLCRAQDEDAPSVAPENPLFTDQIANGNPEAIDGCSGIMPEPIDFSYLRNMACAMPGALGSLPVSYDLRRIGKLTPIKDQGPIGSCWTFAAMGSIESNLLPGETCDLSENNMKNQHGFDVSPSAGGNRSMATAYLARWTGPVAEADDPYNPYSSTSPYGLAAKKHVQDVIYIPDRNGSLDNSALKQAIMSYGAVYTTYYHDDSYYSASDCTYYYSGYASPNHAVCLVGWDDSFDKDKFATPAPGNGAFIVRNSWGEYWGSAGYYYISYYDTQVGTENAVFQAEPTSDYNSAFQYDTLGWTSSSGYGNNTAWFANVFSATSACSIAAASWYVATPGSYYELYVYVNPADGPCSTSGAKVMKAGYIETPGYHTFKLEAPVSVAAGQKFSVVVKLTTPDYDFPVPLERPMSGYCSKATASAGQSYMSSNGTSWTDVTRYYTNTNVCLKAFGTAAAAAAATGKLATTSATEYDTTGLIGGPFSPASQTVVLKNSGNAPVDWVASATKPWVTLSRTSGNLVAGASASVAISVNTSAKTLTAGTYSDTVTFKNSTNGAGDVSVGVILVVKNRYAITVTPTANSQFSGSMGGSFTPTGADYVVTNTGTGSLGWTAESDRPWISLSSQSGSLDPTQRTTVTASVNSLANVLQVGSYTGTITFTNLANGSKTTRGVSLTVKVPPVVYGEEPTDFNWIDPSGHRVLKLADNSCINRITLPFGFEYYGKVYTTVDVGSNGIAGFSGAVISGANNTSIPTLAAPNAALYPYWDDLDPSRVGTVTIGTAGTMPNRKVVISWVGVPLRQNQSSRLTFQVVLCEGTNDVVFQYLDVAARDAIYGGGASATIGVENTTGDGACLLSFNQIGAIGNNTAVRFFKQ